MTIVDRGVRRPARPSSTAGIGRRLWDAPLAAHAAVLAVILVALLPVLAPRGSFTSDEGAYALQVHSLEHGGWTYDYKAAPYDPTNASFPIILGDRNGGDYYPYVKHPAFPILLRGAAGLLGETLGLHALLLLGAVGTAVGAWLLARELDPALARPAFWLAAAGPVVVNGFLLWAHALSAAVAALSLVVAIRVARDGLRPWRAVVLAAGLAVGVLLRSEGLLFAVAVTAGLGWVVLRRRGVRVAAVTAAVAGAPAVLATAVEQRWIRAIVGGRASPLAVRGSGPTSYLRGRIDGAWHELFQAGADDRRALVLGLLAIGVAVGVAALALRRRRPTAARELAVGLGAGVALLVVRFVLAPTDPITGFFAASPVVLLGLCFLPWRSIGPEGRFLAAVACLFLAAVLATQYPEGGGFEWGGRFLAPLAAPLAVLAVAGLRSRVRLLPGGPRAVALATSALAVTAATVTVLGLVNLGVLRGRQDALVGAVARHPATVTVTTIDALPRLGWRVDGQVRWMLTDSERLPALLAHLAASNVPRVTVVTGDGTSPSVAAGAYPHVQAVPEPAAERFGAEILVLSR